MARGTGIAILNFPASAQAAEYSSPVSVVDSNPNPNVFQLGDISGAYISAQAGCNAVGITTFLDFSSAKCAVTYDDKTWFYYTPPTLIQPKDIAYGNGVFVALPGGGIGGSVGLSSTDGCNWVNITCPTGLYLFVEYTGTKFIAFGGSNSIESSDGTVWVGGSALPATVNAMSHSEGYYLFVTTTSTVAYRSTDAVNWNSFTLPILYSGNGGIWAIGGRFIYSNTPGTGWASDDQGVTWYSVSVPPTGSYPMRLFNGYLVQISSATKINVSADGISWKTAVHTSNVTAACLVHNSRLIGFPSNSLVANSIYLDLYNTRTSQTVNHLTRPAASNPGTNTASTTVSVPAITADSSISAFLISDTTADHNAYEHEVLDLKLSCDTIVPGVGFTINAYSDDRLDGDFKVRYAWGTP
jgi:hypothetical protein